MQNFQCIIFIWTQTYMEHFKSALVYFSYEKFAVLSNGHIISWNKTKIFTDYNDKI